MSFKTQNAQIYKNFGGHAPPLAVVLLRNVYYIGETLWFSINNAFLFCEANEPEEHPLIALAFFISGLISDIATNVSK